MNEQKAIGERLLIARRRHAWTQQELAERAGVKPLTISRIERGEFQAMPRPATLRGIADALEVDPGWLLYGESEEGKAAA